MEITANHTDPGEWVPCIGTSFIQSHHMSQVGQLCVFLNQTHLRSVKREKVADMRPGYLLFISNAKCVSPANKV